MDKEYKFGKHIKRMRNDRNASLHDVASKTGVSANYISELEKGIKKNPSDEVIHGLADYFDVSSTELFEMLGVIPSSVRHQYTSNSMFKEIINDLGKMSTYPTKDREEVYTKILRILADKLEEVGEVKGMTAEQILKEIDNMSNGERIKLLDVLFHRHFNNGVRENPFKEVKEDE